MNEQQVKWAQQHDWFFDSVEVEKGLFKVRVESEWSEEVLEFACFRELREWAGY